MKLYISSFGLGNRTDVLKNWINENDNKIALIPNSRDILDDERRQAGIDRDTKALEELGFEVTVISLRDYFGMPDKLREDLNKFRAFFAIGGNVFTLRQAMKLSGFDEYLKEMINQDILYSGYSAGICLLAPNMQGLELVDDPNVDVYGCDPIFEGLGIIDFVPIPHFDSDHPESEIINDVIEYMQINGINHKPMRDGDVIIEEAVNHKLNK